MDFATAIAKVTALEGGEELASAINGHVSDLDSKLSTAEAKTHTVIGEKRAATQQNASLREAVQSMAKSVGVEGEVSDILEALPSKVQSLSSAASSSQKAATEWETKAKDFESKLLDANNAVTFAKASSHGVNPDALKTVLGDIPATRLKFSDDGIAIAGEDGKTETPLKDFVESSNKAWLAPALFSDKPQEKKGGKTAPSGGGGGGESKADPLSEFKAKHKVPSFLSK